jgi:hypothetical protein
MRCVEIGRKNGFGRREVANAVQVCQTKIFLLEFREALNLALAAVAEQPGAAV